MGSAYRDRPWLRLYQQGKPADITPGHSDALSMWHSGLARFGDRPFLYYFDTPVTADTVEADSDALAAALAAYKYPRRVEVLPELPETPTGKLLRRELRDHARDLL